MKWYTWLPWILFVLTLAGSIIWYVVQKSKWVTAKLKMSNLERQAAQRIAKVEVEAEVEIRKQKEQTTKALAKLEEVFKTQLEGLTNEERVEYEKAKVDPESGVNFVLGFLGQSK